MRNARSMPSLGMLLAVLALVALSAGVTAEGPGAGRMSAEGEGTAERAEPGGTAAPAPAKTLWLTPGALADDTARDLGLRIVDRSEVSTLFEADLESAYRLFDRGHFIARAGIRPAADLARQHFGEAFTRDLIAEHPLTAELKRLVASLVDSVSADSIRETIRLLSYDTVGGKYRSRFAPRRDLARDITPYISAKLAAYLGAEGVVDGQDFQPLLPAQYRGEDSIFVNVVARLPGKKTGAHYVICAHYDAIAVRDPLWQASSDAWKTVAAPGADDNATGVAALLETARLVAGLDLDIGVTFIAFSGEELGLLGSDAYVEALAETDSIIGVLNLDMMGHAEGARQIALTYDLQSSWLGDLMDSTAHEASIASPIQAYDGTGSARGDHASFWQAGVPAVLLADAQDGKGNPLYPHYHTTADTLGRVDIEQVCDNARLAVAYLARFAEVQGETTCDFALTEGSVEWQWEGRAYRPLIAGDSVTAVVRAVNQGGSMPQPASYSCSFILGGDWLGWLMGGSIATIQVAAGGIAEIATTLPTGRETYGELKYLIIFEPLSPGVEDDLDNNRVVVSLNVMPPSTMVRNLHVFPNPVSQPDQANLRFEILHPENDFAGRLTLWIYDLEGDLAGTAVLVRNHLGVEDVAIGVNTVPLGSVIPAASELAPGLYICVAQLEVSGQEGLAVAKSKFAVAR
jgi:hypothetical protein